MLIVNLDQPDPGLGFKAGELLAQHLAGPDLGAAAGRDRWRRRGCGPSGGGRQAADVAVIIPADSPRPWPSRASKPAVTLYHHPDSEHRRQGGQGDGQRLRGRFRRRQDRRHVTSHQLEARA